MLEAIIVRPLPHLNPLYCFKWSLLFSGPLLPKHQWDSWVVTPHRSKNRKSMVQLTNKKKCCLLPHLDAEEYFPLKHGKWKMRESRQSRDSVGWSSHRSKKRKKKRTLIIHCFLEEMEFSDLIEKTFLNFSAFLCFLRVPLLLCWQHVSCCHFHVCHLPQQLQVPWSRNHALYLLPDSA